MQPSELSVQVKNYAPSSLLWHSSSHMGSSAGQL
uniref:Uncharacterized protein n=1 Tax=Rhizophora mucronata TaxID=61149 RepID=A0A2P2MPK0_RHIMU